MSEEQEEALAEVERAVVRREMAERAMVAAIVDAADLGLTATQIARSTGTSRQAVDQLLQRTRR